MNSPRRKYYTLVELLCVMMILAILGNVFSLFMMNGRKLYRQAVEHTLLHQRSGQLRNGWRQFIAAGSEFLVLEDDQSLRIGDNLAQAEDNRLTLTTEDGTREWVLPKSVGFRLRIEKGGGKQDLAILEILYNNELKQRIVACHES